jgi:hypothetical protein
MCIAVELLIGPSVVYCLYELAMSGTLPRQSSKQEKDAETVL